MLLPLARVDSLSPTLWPRSKSNGLPRPPAKARARRRLSQHHYLGDVRAAGEQLRYVVSGAHGG